MTVFDFRLFDFLDNLIASLADKASVRDFLVNYAQKKLSNLVLYFQLGDFLCRLIETRVLRNLSYFRERFFLIVLLRKNLYLVLPEKIATAGKLLHRTTGERAIQLLLNRVQGVVEVFDFVQIHIKAFLNEALVNFVRELL